jgi:hypothetical protein
MGPGDHKCHDGQARIATVKTRDKHDEVIVQEKLDGSNVGVARIGEHKLIPLGRAGYPAISSRFLQHRLFHNWVFENATRLLAVLQPGERLVGEWLAQAHGTRYDLNRWGDDLEPFVAFDLMIGQQRTPYMEFVERTRPGCFFYPPEISRGSAISIERVMEVIGDTNGKYCAVDPVEGAVWRVERDKLTDRHSGKRKRVVDFLVKYVRPDKIDGCYLPSVSGSGPIWNWRPPAPKAEEAQHCRYCGEVMDGPLCDNPDCEMEVEQAAEAGEEGQHG